MKTYTYNSPRYKKWRQRVFAAGNFTCQMCGKKGGELNAHHIKRKADYPRLAYSVKNGITLCIPCHEIITGSEKIFESLLKKIRNHTIDFEYITQFFYKLSQKHPLLVAQFKQAGKWLKIASFIVQNIKPQNDKKPRYNKSVPGRRRAKRKRAVKVS